MFYLMKEGIMNHHTEGKKMASMLVFLYPARYGKILSI
ncbi:hypothetical protein BG07_5774 (plasmid) [Bacillus pseudomycoides]|nr:hypothetical protein BG07_5774 [Bacillus pseudomycoides]